MPNIDIKITNLPQIKAAFNKAPAVMRVNLNKAIKKSIFTIQRQSMINTPVLTGRLRASTASAFSDLRGEVGTHTNYDLYVHEGTRYMKARPYLREAVEAENGAVNKYFQEAVQDTLDVIGRTV